ncbi:HI1506-related protein [Citrobacter portucalensis]|uniref:HI1506-related protein n=1 Tax=Citrobacter portucalensis TaxID=1639133 RepID=UPI00226BB086|nr:HI1506-related protein [Citrobacter portucalensis]MCX9056598.1 HI1506-related protein [Citrobacter portucalensis]
MPIQITAKRDGFRRCGIAHSETTTTYADEHFTQAQLQELKSEPNLIVIEVAEGAETGNVHTALVDAGNRIVELEAVALQLNSDASELKSKLDTVTAERDELAAKLGLLTATGSDGAQVAEPAQDTKAEAADEAGSADDKTSGKKKG